MTDCLCGRDHDADRAEAVHRWEYEKSTGTSLAGHPLRQRVEIGRHYGGTWCDGECCDGPTELELDERWAAERYSIGNDRAREQTHRWRGTLPPIRPEPADPTAILDEPYVPDWQRRARALVAAGPIRVARLGDDPSLDVWCDDCGRAHPLLLDMIESVQIALDPDDDAEPVVWSGGRVVSISFEPTVLDRALIARAFGIDPSILDDVPGP